MTILDGNQWQASTEPQYEVKSVTVNLMIGDCIERMKEIADGSVDLVLCDPPYGTTACKWDAVIPFEPMWAEVKRVLKPNGAAVLFSAQPFTSALILSNINEFKYEWAWRKEAGTGFLNAKKQPLRDVEYVAVFYHKQPTYNPQMRAGFKPYKTTKGGDTDNYNDSSIVTTESDGSRYPLSTVEFSRDRNKVHPTQKPIALMEYLTRTYTNEGETVLDFTMGSGTTGVACVNTGRNFIGIERDEGYFQIAKDRIKGAMSPKPIEQPSLF